MCNFLRSFQRTNLNLGIMYILKFIKENSEKNRRKMSFFHEILTFQVCLSKFSDKSYMNLIGF